MKHVAREANTPSDLGKVLKTVRKEAGLSQSDLSALIGCSRTTLFRMERGDSVSQETLLRALSECGHTLIVAPKFCHVHVS